MPNMLTARHGHAMIAVNNVVFAVGGREYRPPYYKVTGKSEAFVNGSWRSIKSLPIVLENSCIVKLDNNTFMVAGGRSWSIVGFKFNYKRLFF